MDKINILGVYINPVTSDQAWSIIEDWLNSKQKHYIVTPNLEFLIEAQTNSAFRQILNQADLSIPDSARLGTILRLTQSKSILSRLLLALTLPFTSQAISARIPTLTGVDLMDTICQKSAQNGLRIALLGGFGDTATQTKQRLLKKYPQLNIVYAQSGGDISQSGEWPHQEPISSCDFLFVALGQVKQENWIVKNMAQVNAQVFIGVGGAFDYLSGTVPRAPQLIRHVGLEWLFRLIVQPWRLTRQLKIIHFLSRLVFQS